MKLVHPDLQFQIQFADTAIPVCVVESPVWWRALQKELLAQMQGENGKWVLSEQDKEMKINKSVELILNPMQLEENQKRILNAFVQSFSKTATNETYWKKGQELNAIIQTFFSELEMEYPFEYHINSEIEFAALAKAMGIRIETEYESDLERLLQYCILTQDLLNTKLFLFFHLHAYFTEEELELFYHEARQRKWNILLMESSVGKRLSNEKYYIIDKDNCEIY